MLRSHTVSVANSFGGSFVRVIWLDYQPQPAVAATPLADSTSSDHDSPNATATALSVYVIVRPAATENAACTMALGLGCGRYFQMMWRDSNTGPEVNQGLCHNRQTRCLLQQAQHVLLRGVGLSQHCSGGLL